MGRLDWGGDRRGRIAKAYLEVHVPLGLHALLMPPYLEVDALLVPPYLEVDAPLMPSYLFVEAQQDQQEQEQEQ